MTSLKRNKSQNELVSIIIVTWNGLHWLKKSLPSLEQQEYKNIEVILVDNASTDGTISWVKKHYATIRIIALDYNAGFAEANNQGYEASRGTYVLFMNNDVVVTKTFLTELVLAVTADKTIAGLQSKIVLLDDQKRLDTIGAFLTPTGFLYHYAFMNLDQPKFDRSINLYTPKGACMLFRKSLLEQVKVQGYLFDPDAFAYFEETDVSHRVWLAGYRIVYAPRSLIYHKMGGTSTTMNNAFIQYHSFKNRICTYLKNLELINLLQILPVHLLCCQIFALLYIIKGKPSVSLCIEKAIFWNIINLGSTLKKRKYIQQNIRTRPDHKFFSAIYKPAPLAFYLAQSQGIPYIEA